MDEPDYRGIRRLLRQAMRRLGVSSEHPMEWEKADLSNYAITATYEEAGGRVYDSDQSDDDDERERPTDKTTQQGQSDA